MALKGDLASVDLAQVFQMLALNQKVGMLSIQAPGTWKALYFDQRGVTLYFNEHLVLDRVLGTMTRSGQLQQEVVQESRDHAASQGVSVVDSLLAGGYVSEEDFEESFRQELEEEIYDLFFWREAKFEFFEGATGFEGREGSVNERFFFSTDSLIMEAARRIDEWAFIQERVPGPEEIFRPTDESPNILKLEDVALSVHELVDGKRNVERLIEITGLSSFHVYKSLAQLLDEQMIKRLDSSDLVDAAKECVAEGRLQDAINLYERAISLDVGLPETHALAAHAYESTQEFELAGYHLKCVAEYYASAGNVVEAVDLLRRVNEMLPTDLATRERIVELTVGSSEFKGDDAQTVAEAKALVDLYLEIEQVERVRGILERLLHDNPSDVELKKSLVNVYAKTGDQRRVMELYESIADDLVAKANPIEAVKYLQKILMIDRSRKDISDRIRSLYELDERRRSRRRSIALVGVGICIVLGLIGAWFLYEQNAREKFNAIDVDVLVRERNYNAAVAVYQEFMDSHPWTLVSKDVRSAITRLESMRLAHEEQLRADRRQREEEQNKLRLRYKLAWDRYLTEFRAEDLGAALEQLELCRSLVEETAEPVDVKWAQDKKLEKVIGDLRTYIGNAAALERVARELVLAGDWRQAREKLLELTSKYDMTEVAKRARIPVMLTSRPAGAVIAQGGRPLVKVVDGAEVELRTPAVVFCQQEIEERFMLRHPGFKPVVVDLRAAEAAVSHHVLSVVPAAVIDFGAPVQTAPGVGRDYLVAGLQGGRLGVARSDGGGRLPGVQLEDLREVVGRPAVVGDHFYFRTNQSEIVCRLLSGLQRWVSGNGVTAATDPVVVNGRVLFFDIDGGLVCLDADDGSEFWRATMPSPAAGLPAAEGRLVRVGTTAGELLLIDLVSGAVLRQYSGLPGFGSSPLLAPARVAYGTVEGRVALVDEKRGVLIWSMDVGRTPSTGEIAVVGDSVVVLAQGDRIVRLSMLDGAEAAQFKLPGARLSGPLAVGSRVFVTARVVASDRSRQDVLIALDAETMQIAWEFSDGGLFRGPLGADAESVYLPDSTTRVVRFQ